MTQTIPSRPLRSGIGTILLGALLLVLLASAAVLVKSTLSRAALRSSTADREASLTAESTAVIEFGEKTAGNGFLPRLKSAPPAELDSAAGLTILLAGIPGAGNPSPNLTDSLMLINVRAFPGTTRVSRVSLLSVPRDLFVRLPAAPANTHVRINSVYQAFLPAGQSEALRRLKKVVERVTGVSVQHALVADLSVVAQVINMLGGVYVLVKEPIDDPLFPGPNYSYAPFRLASGWRYLDGETALKYVRTRHDPRGDFSRIERQQQVIAAVRQKLENMTVVKRLPALWSIYQKLQSHIATDLSFSQALGLWNLTRGLSPDLIHETALTSDPNNVLTGERLTVSGGQQASVLRPRAGWDDYSQVHKFVSGFFNGQ